MVKGFKKTRFYVQAITAKGIVQGYGVYDEIGGIVSEYERFEIAPNQDTKTCLYLANTLRDDLNGKIK